uniref:RXT3-like protein C1259.07 n=1 Tax=Anthurium amnicola TaxID=1678845 RepID=A0A1D1YG60_9ARAE
MSGRLNNDTMIIKAKRTNHGETTARRIHVEKDIKLEELEYKIRERFDISYDKGVELFYVDEDNDRVVVTFEDELTLALGSNKVPVFEIVVKPRVIDSEYTYPQVPRGKPGDCVEILVESQFLTLANAMRDDTKAWGTYAYTNDSDIVKVLAHSEKIDLPENPPPFNAIITLRLLPGNLKYIGSTSQGITTLNYGPYDSSYIIESVRTVPIHEKAYFDSNDI